MEAKQGTTAAPGGEISCLGKISKAEDLTRTGNGNQHPQGVRCAWVLFRQGYGKNQQYGGSY